GGAGGPDVEIDVIGVDAATSHGFLPSVITAHDGVGLAVFTYVDRGLHARARDPRDDALCPKIDDYLEELIMGWVEDVCESPPPEWHARRPRQHITLRRFLQLH